MQVLAGWEQVAREPVGMSRGHLFDALFSFRRVSPLQLDQGASFRLAEKTKSGGTASFRPDTKGVFLFLALFYVSLLLLWLLCTFLFVSKEKYQKNATQEMNPRFLPCEIILLICAHFASAKWLMRSRVAV